MKGKLELRVIEFFIILYAIYDVMTSSSAGNDNTQRSQVYVFLIIILGIMLVSLLFRGSFKTDYTIIGPLLFLIYYFFDESLIKGSTGWNLYVYCSICVWWVLTLIFFNNLISQEPLLINEIMKFCKLMFLFYVVAVIYGSLNIRSSFRSVQYARVGYIYHVLSILPILLLAKKRNKYIILASIMSVFSFKRGAIIVLPITVFSFYFIENRIGIKKNNLLRVFYITVFFAILFVIFDKISGGYLSSRFSYESMLDGSGRAEMIDITLSNLSKRRLIQLLFGIRNIDEVYIVGGAHNEWLRHLYSNGLICLIIYVSFFLHMLKESIRLIRKKSVLAPAFGAMTIYSTGIGVVSGWYFMHSTFYIMIFIAVAMALKQYDNQYILELLEGEK